MKTVSIMIACGAVLFSTTSNAAEYLSETCETALALSALPSHLRADASAYVRTENGFVKAKQGDGPFTCIVERNHPQSLVPQCLDVKGTEVILPAIMHKTEMAFLGATPAEIRAEFNARVDEGQFSPPDGIGVNYMMSHYNYIYLAGPDAIRRVPPHLMHYAPNMSIEDAGITHRGRGLPTINQPGAHGYYISFVEDPADPSDVQSACAGEVDENPPS